MLGSSAAGEDVMITLGVDAHKQVHAAVALDEAGQALGHWRGPNSRRGWQALHEWAVGLDGPRQWGIEGAWNYGRGLAQYLVDAGEVVYEVNPRWTAEGRRSARRPGKSDALDARAVALLVQREAATLPRVGADDETAVLELLVTERDGAVAEAPGPRHLTRDRARATFPRGGYATAGPPSVGSPAVAPPGVPSTRRAALRLVGAAVDRAGGQAASSPIAPSGTGTEAAWARPPSGPTR
jgi:transposase